MGCTLHYEQQFHKHSTLPRSPGYQFYMTNELGLSISFPNNIYIFQITIMSFTAFLQTIACLVTMNIKQFANKMNIFFWGKDLYKIPIIIHAPT